MYLSVKPIYCAGKNKTFDAIALESGFELGARLPCTIYYPILFADQEWEEPNRNVYMQKLVEHKPKMATVLDLERPDQRDEVLSWAEEAAQFVERVLIIPKYSGAVDGLPRRIGNADVILAYSVPTAYGGTEVPPWEFQGWPVHLLGGSPHSQMKLTRYMDVVSIDGNMHTKMATRRCQFWTNGTAKYAKNRYWPKLSEDGWHGENAPTEAFRRSCENIIEAWRNL